MLVFSSHRLEACATAFMNNAGWTLFRSVITPPQGDSALRRLGAAGAPAEALNGRLAVVHPCLAQSRLPFFRALAGVASLTDAGRNLVAAAIGCVALRTGKLAVCPD